MNKEKEMIESLEDAINYTNFKYSLLETYTKSKDFEKYKEYFIGELKNFNQERITLRAILTERLGAEYVFGELGRKCDEKMLEHNIVTIKKITDLIEQFEKEKEDEHEQEHKSDIMRGVVVGENVAKIVDEKTGKVLYEKEEEE